MARGFRNPNGDHLAQQFSAVQCFLARAIAVVYIPTMQGVPGLVPMLENALGRGNDAPVLFSHLCVCAWFEGLLRHDPEAPREVVLCRDLHGRWRILTKRPFFEMVAPKPFEPSGDLVDRVALLAAAFGQLAVELGLAGDAAAAAGALMAAMVGATVSADVGPGSWRN